jgi:hypothetical protein
LAGLKKEKVSADKGYRVCRLDFTTSSSITNIAVLEAVVVIVK